MSHIKTSLRLPDGHFELLGKRQSMVALEQVYSLLEMSSWFHSCLMIMVCSYSLSQRFPSHSSIVKNVASVKMCCISYRVKVQGTAEWRLTTLNATSFLNAQWQSNSRIDHLWSVRCRGWYLWIYNTSQTPTPYPLPPPFHSCAKKRSNQRIWPTSWTWCLMLDITLLETVSPSGNRRWT